MPNKGISHVSVSFFCLTLPKNFVRDPFCVSEKFWYRNILWIGREYHMFPSSFFRLTLPKNFVGGTPRCFRTFLVSNNFIDKKGRMVGVSQLSIEKFCLTVPKTWLWNPSVFQRISVVEKIYA